MPCCGRRYVAATLDEASADQEQPERGIVDDDEADIRVTRAWDEAFNRDTLGHLLSSQDVHPDDVYTLLRSAPLALAHLTWRNTVPHGVTLGDLGQDELAELQDHAEGQLGALLAKAEEHGAAVVLAFLGLRRRLACRD